LKVWAAIEFGIKLVIQSGYYPFWNVGIGRVQSRIAVERDNAKNRSWLKCQFRYRSFEIVVVCTRCACQIANR
jgi:hypothetical protein